MPQTHQLTPRTFWHLLPLPRKAPLVARGHTQEIDDEFRRGESLVFRIPWTKLGVVVGRWTAKAPDEETALLHAIGGTEDTHAAAEVREWDPAPFDRGGGLPAEAYAVNTTGLPEPVFTAEQLRQAAQVLRDSKW